MAIENDPIAIERLQGALDAAVAGCSASCWPEVVARVLGINEVYAEELIGEIAEQLEESLDGDRTLAFTMGATWGLLIGEQFGYGNAMDRLVGV